MTYTATYLLDGLAYAYAEARADQLEHSEADEADRCRYCGRSWIRWAGSKLDGHAVCTVTKAFRARLLGDMTSARGELTYDVVASKLGVSEATVQAWYTQALVDAGFPAGRHGA
jgi:hypothetical protein